MAWRHILILFGFVLILDRASLNCFSPAVSPRTTGVCHEAQFFLTGSAYAVHWLGTLSPASASSIAERQTHTTELGFWGELDLSWGLPCDLCWVAGSTNVCYCARSSYYALRFLVMGLTVPLSSTALTVVLIHWGRTLHIHLPREWVGSLELLGVWGCSFNHPAGQLFVNGTYLVTLWDSETPSTGLHLQDRTLYNT